MRNLLTIALFLALAIRAAAAPHYALPVRATAPRTDGGAFAQPTRLLNGKSVRMEPTQWLDENDPLTCYRNKAPDGTSCEVRLQFDDPGPQLLRCASRRTPRRTAFHFRERPTADKAAGRKACFRWRTLLTIESGAADFRPMTKV
jgi:hypothetical protein